MTPVLVALALAAADPETPPVQPVPAAPAAPVPMAPVERELRPAVPCPLAVPGTLVRPEDVDDGVAILYLSGEDRVDEVRARVRATGALGSRALEEGVAACCPPSWPAAPPASVEVREVSDGAALVLRPSDPSRLEWLRIAVRQQAWRAQAGECRANGF